MRFAVTHLIRMSKYLSITSLVKKVINTVLPFTIFYFICKGDFAYMLYLSTAQMQCLLMQKALDLLELELEMTVNCHVGARIEPRSSGKATSMISH